MEDQEIRETHEKEMRMGQGLGEGGERVREQERGQKEELERGLGMSNNDQCLKFSIWGTGQHVYDIQQQVKMPNQGSMLVAHVRWNNG